MLNIYSQQNNHESMPQSVNRKEGGVSKVNYLNYVDASGDFGSKDFQRSLWLARNKMLLYRLVVAWLIIVGVFLWVFSSWRWINYGVFGIMEDQQLYRDLRRFPNYTAVNARMAPQSLNILDTRILPGGVNKYDAVAQINNPNQHFMVEFDYYFTIDGQQKSRRKAFLLPGEIRPLVEFGLEAGAGTAVLLLENVRWQRIATKFVANPDWWQKERLNFRIENFNFVRPEAVNGANAFGIQFTLVNNGSYGYTEPEFIVGLLSGEELVGVMPLKLKNLTSQEKRSIDLRNFSPNLNVNEIKLFPIINVYDSEMYLRP